MESCTAGTLKNASSYSTPRCTNIQEVILSFRGTDSGTGNFAMAVGSKTLLH